MFYDMSLFLFITFNLWLVSLIWKLKQEHPLGCSFLLCLHKIQLIDFYLDLLYNLIYYRICEVCSMIGIIGAMAIEVKNLIAVMSDEKVETISSVTYHIGKIEGVECVVAQSGVGKVAAAICAQTMFLKYQPSALINVGVAGGMGQDIHIGDIVISRGLVQHDMDTSAIGDVKGFISGINLLTIPASERLVNLVESTAAGFYGRGIHVGIIATGDQFIGNGDRLKQIAAEFGAVACEMEGGSIAQVCYINHLDFVVIRAISDNADDNASIDYASFTASSAHKITALMKKLLPSI